MILRDQNDLSWHDTRTNFHDDQFRLLSNITLITATIWELVTSALVFEEIYEISFEMALCYKVLYV
jgi:hypothetical protein